MIGRTTRAKAKSVPASSEQDSNDMPLRRPLKNATKSMLPEACVIRLHMLPVLMPRKRTRRQYLSQQLKHRQQRPFEPAQGARGSSGRRRRTKRTVLCVSGDVYNVHHLSHSRHRDQVFWFSLHKRTHLYTLHTQLQLAALFVASVLQQYYVSSMLACERVLKYLCSHTKLTTHAWTTAFCSHAAGLSGRPGITSPR